MEFPTRQTGPRQTPGDAVAKVHPALREMLPDDPLELNATVVEGDPDLMLRMIVEEYARIGCDADRILALARDPFYMGLHGLWLAWGEAALRQRVEAILGRCGVIRVRHVEAPPQPPLVQLEMPHGAAAPPARDERSCGPARAARPDLPTALDEGVGHGSGV